jgi:hypothetical protein
MDREGKRPGWAGRSLAATRNELLAASLAALEWPGKGLGVVPAVTIAVHASQWCCTCVR